MLKRQIYSAIAPDHGAIYILLSWTGKTSRGSGLWKFNNTLLSDERYVAIVRDKYSQARFYHSYLTDKRLFWEMMKMEIRTATISYAKSKANSTSDHELEIRRHLERLDNTICNNFSPLNIDDILKEYDCLKSELQSIYDDKGRQAMFRAKCQWVEYGEHLTKFFFNMEKRNCNKKTISELRLQDESTTTNEKKILDHIENYYKNLFTSEATFSQVECDEFTQHLEIPKLSDQDRESLEGPLSYEECTKLLETFQNDKAPGEDGFTEFYKFFFELLGDDLIASFNEAHEANELSISEQREIITLIPKEDGLLLDLPIWRPITLLHVNVDYKIAAKAIAEWLESVLPNLIHPDQTG